MIEQEQQLQDLLKPEFKVLSIDNTNFKPHPFMIGPNHISHASNYGGMLGNTTLEAIPCAYPGCQLPYKDHTSNRVSFIQLTQNLSNKKAKEVLLKAESFMKEHKIEGFAFVETPEKFRVT